MTNLMIGLDEPTIVFNEDVNIEFTRAAHSSDVTETSGWMLFFDLRLGFPT
jgi:hypothetical protein